MRYYVKHSYIPTLQAAQPQLKIKDWGVWGVCNIPKAIAAAINAQDPQAYTANSLIHNIKTGFSH
jgi:hypothetical protein